MIVHKKSGGVWHMSDLQEQAMQIIGEMSEEKLKVFVPFMQMFIQSKNNIAMDGAVQSGKKNAKRIGIAEGENLYDHDYDFDEYNGEIAKMFGVM